MPGCLGGQGARDLGCKSRGWHPALAAEAPGALPTGQGMVNSRGSGQPDDARLHSVHLGSIAQTRGNTLPWP